MRSSLAFVALAALGACSSPDPSNTPMTPVDAAVDAPADASADVATDAMPTPDVAPDAMTTTHLAWRQVDVPTSGPTARWGYMVAPVGDGTAYVYGGTTLTNAGAGSVSNDLWLVDGRGEAPTFTRLTVTGEPPPRYCGCLAYIPASRSVLMIGGRNPSEAPAETWSLSLETMAWSRVAVPRTPGGVIGCSMAWSTARSALYHFGGGSASTGFSSAVSRFDPSGPAWVAVDATGPRGRYDDAFVPLPDGRRFVMTAGARGAAAGPAFLHDTWIFDAMAESWQEVTTEGDTPPGRRNPFVSVDSDGNGLVMAMGSTGIQAGEVLDDLWHLDLTSGRWTNLDPESAPGARGFITALPGHGSVRGYLIGGFDNERVLRDVWALREE